MMLARSPIIRLAVFAFLAALTSLRCTGSSGSDADCTAGATRDCTCETDIIDLDGTQTCSAGGTWSDCDCSGGDSDLDLDIDTDADTDSDSDTDTTACTTADDCPAGQGCHAAEGECGPCRAAEECRENEACDDGVCGGCTASDQCGGLLCRSGACEKCIAGTDDAECATAYDDADYTCFDSGRCGPLTCTATTDCMVAKRICSAQGRCVVCQNDQECLAEGYPAGTLCIDELCKQGAECEGDADCPQDKPICGRDSRCRNCQSNVECTEALHTTAVCDTATGLCHEGQCWPRDEECCDADGSFQPDTFRCDPEPVDTDYQCQGTQCGADPEFRHMYRYCSGDEGRCTGANLVWEDWQRIDFCQIHQLCHVTADSGECVSCEHGCKDGECYRDCSPSDPCCRDDGIIEADNVKCNATPYTTEYRCDGADLCTSNLLQRHVYQYCNGTSADCGIENLVPEGDWEITPAGGCQDGFDPVTASDGNCYCKPAPDNEQEPSPGRPGAACKWGEMYPDEPPCGPGMTCLGRAPDVEQYPCQTDADCEVFRANINPTCVNGGCGFSYCALGCSTGGACEANAKCNLSMSPPMCSPCALECRGDSCYGDCQTNADCPGEVCVDLQCQACTASSQCDNNQVCDNGVCFDGNCNQDSDCEDRGRCVNETCINHSCYYLNVGCDLTHGSTVETDWLGTHLTYPSFVQDVSDCGQDRVLVGVQVKRSGAEIYVNCIRAVCLVAESAYGPGYNNENWFHYGEPAGECSSTNSWTTGFCESGMMVGPSIRRSDDTDKYPYGVGGLCAQGSRITRSQAGTDGSFIPEPHIDRGVVDSNQCPAGYAANRIEITYEGKRARKIRVRCVKLTSNGCCD